MIFYFAQQCCPTNQKELEGGELMRRQCNFTSGGEGGDGCLVGVGDIIEKIIDSR